MLFLEIKRAVKILQAMKAAHKSQQGAIALDGQMIDAPMIKQVCYLRCLRYFSIEWLHFQALKTMSLAELAGLLRPR